MNKPFLIILFTLFFSSCHMSHGGRTVYYKVNDNFTVKSDSLSLQCEEPMHNRPVDTLSGCVSLYEGDRFVVAQIMTIPEDSIDSVWVKLARDQTAMGWLRQNAFLENSIPDAPIPQFISALGELNRWYSAIVLLLVALLAVARWRGLLSFHMVFVHDIPSFYPSMLVLTTGAASILYAGIQKFSPEKWLLYYYHPTLNPFSPEPLIGIFVAMLWLAVVLFISAVDEVLSQLRPVDSLLYIFTLLGICLASCMLFSMADVCTANCFILLAFAVFAVRRYVKNSFPCYQCGRCGAKMNKKGRCERCGAINK